MSTVVQIVQHLRPGGIETMALDLTVFCESNENTLIISLEGDLESAIAAWPRLEPFRERLLFLGKQPGLRPSVVLQLSCILTNLAVDVVHTHHIGPLLYGGLAARMAGVRTLIHTEHDAWHLDNLRRRTIQRWAIRLLKPLLVADADTVAVNMRERLDCGDDDIEIIHNGVDTEWFIPGNKSVARRQFGLPQGVQIIGCSGRLEEVKGQRVLIDAMLWLPTEVHLALAGVGEAEEALHRQVEELGLESRVHFLGRIDEMPTFYQALDIFCLPSFNEGFPLSPLEAQACNIPTLVTDVGGSHETLCPNSGELVPTGDPNSMAASLRRMLTIHYKNGPRKFIQQRGDVRLMASAYAALRQLDPGRSLR